MPGSQTQKQTSNSQNDPWSVQAPFLTQGFNAAQTALGQAQNAPKPTDFVAGFTPDQLNTFRQMISAGSNPNVPASSANAGGALSAAGAGAATGALSDLAGYTPGGGVDSNIAAASKYADNPAMSGMVDAAMRDARRSVSEQVLPQVARNARGSGNINSNRTAITEGIVQRGLADATADTSASLRGDAFNNGLALAENGRQSDNSGILSALMARVNGGTSAANAGTNANTASVGQQGGLFDMAAQGGAGQQAANQAGLDNELQKYNFATQAPFDALNNYWNIVGSNQWGGTSSGTSTATSSPSIWQILGGLSGAAGSLMKCDHNEKVDISKIGELFDGIPIYRFRYKDDAAKAWHIGPMAQEVEKLYPRAVTEIAGVKYVNIDLATRRAAYGLRPF